MGEADIKTEAGKKERREEGKDSGFRV